MVGRRIHIHDHSQSKLGKRIVCLRYSWFQPHKISLYGGDFPYLYTILTIESLTSMI